MTLRGAIETLEEILKSDDMPSFLKPGLEESIRTLKMDAVERKHGKWMLNEDGSGTCSECGRIQLNCWDLDHWDNFCHFCGADMRERTDGDGI